MPSALAAVRTRYGIRMFYCNCCTDDGYLPTTNGARAAVHHQHHHHVVVIASPPRHAAVFVIVVVRQASRGSYIRVILSYRNRLSRARSKISEKYDRGKRVKISFVSGGGVNHETMCTRRQFGSTDEIRAWALPRH